MQGVVKSYDPVTHMGVVVRDTDLSEFDLADDALAVLAARGDRSVESVTLLHQLAAQGEAVQLTLLLTHIAIAGARIRGDAAKWARAEKASVIICGHSHVPFIGQERGLSIFNPGSIGPRRFQLPILFGVMELSPTAVSLRHYDCETGAVWTP